MAAIEPRPGQQQLFEELNNIPMEYPVFVFGVAGVGKTWAIENLIKGSEEGVTGGYVCRFGPGRKVTVANSAEEFAGFMVPAGACVVFELRRDKCIPRPDVGIKCTTE